MPILVMNVVLGTALVATVALGSRRTFFGAASQHRRVVGWLLIALPLPLAVLIEVFSSPPPVFAETAFVAGVVAFAAGALLVLSSDDGDDLRGHGDPDSPPWWPDFEREFRAYARRSSRPHALR